MIKVSLFKKCVGNGKRSKTWWMRWSEQQADGRSRRRQQSTGCTVKTAAEVVRKRKQAELEDEAAGVTNVRKVCRTARFAEYRDKFLKAMELRVRPATLGDYRTSLLKFEEICKPGLLINISIATLDEFKLARAAEGLKPVSIDGDLRAIRRFLNWCHERGVLESVIKVELFNPKAGRLPVSIHRSELQKLIEGIPKVKLRHASAEFWELVVRFMLDSACRRNEVFAMRWRSVLKDKVIVELETTKSVRTRSVFISADISRRLQAWGEKLGLGPDDLVFPRACKDRALQAEFKRITDTVGVSLTFKDLRSTCATEMAAVEPLAVVQNHLGHSTPVLTAKFYVNGEQAARDAANRRKPLGGDDE